MARFTHGIEAIGPMGNTLHFQGFDHEPSVEEWERLDSDLSSDLLADKEYQLYPADPEVVNKHNESTPPH